MDTSETRIKMCEKAGEIQCIAPTETREMDYEDGFSSLFYLPQEQKVALLHWDNDERHWMIGDYHDDTKGAIWLPRQEELQEMLMGEFPMLNWAKQFVHWLNNCDDRTYPSNRFQDGLESPWEIFHSMEQLWLAFVMKTRFEKQWLEGKWVEIAVQQEARYAIR